MNKFEDLLEEFEKKFIKTNERGDIPVPPEIVKRWVKKSLTQAFILGVEAAKKTVEEYFYGLVFMPDPQASKKELIAAIEKGDYKSPLKPKD